MQPDRLPPLRREVCYVSGPYRHPTPAGIWANIMRARDVAMDLWRMGYVAICPHLNTMLFDGIRPDADWLEGDLAILARCDLVVLVPGWRDSAGARAEVEEARRRGIPVYEWVGPGELIPLDESSSQEVRVGREQVCRKTQQPARSIQAPCRSISAAHEVFVLHTYRPRVSDGSTPPAR